MHLGQLSWPQGYLIMWISHAVMEPQAASVGSAYKEQRGEWAGGPRAATLMGTDFAFQGLAGECYDFS